MYLLQADLSINSGDLGITIVTILFALSLISERISNLIKLNKRLLRVKRYTIGGEKRRERDILWLSVVCGIVTAAIAGADLFTLVSEGKLLYISDILDKKTPDLVKACFGILLSGFFVSMGSKFWHDVLDIVLQFSTLKKYKSDSYMAEAKDHLESENAVIKKMLLQKTALIEDQLSKIKGFLGYDVMIKNNEMVLFLHFADKLPLKPEQKWIKDYFEGDKIELQALNSKDHLHANSTRQPHL